MIRRNSIQYHRYIITEAALAVHVLKLRLTTIRRTPERTTKMVRSAFTIDNGSIITTIPAGTAYPQWYNPPTFTVRYIERSAFLNKQFRRDWGAGMEKNNIQHHTLARLPHNIIYAIVHWKDNAASTPYTVGRVGENTTTHTDINVNQDHSFLLVWAMPTGRLLETNVLLLPVGGNV